MVLQYQLCVYLIDGFRIIQGEVLGDRSVLLRSGFPWKYGFVLLASKLEARFHLLVHHSLSPAHLRHRPPRGGYTHLLDSKAIGRGDLLQITLDCEGEWNRITLTENAGSLEIKVTLKSKGKS